MDSFVFSGTVWYQSYEYKSHIQKKMFCVHSFTSMLQLAFASKHISEDDDE